MFGVSEEGSRELFEYGGKLTVVEPQPGTGWRHVKIMSSRTTEGNSTTGKILIEVGIHGP